MTDIIDRTLLEWTRGLSAKAARIAVFNKVRDIPYAIVPELNDPQRFVDILKLNRGSCTPKHFLLCHIFEKLGLEVLYAVYPFLWSDFEALYPRELRDLARTMPVGCHLACRVDIEGQLVLVDATIDPALQKLGLPVNNEWDGFGDTLLAMDPCGEEQLYHPSEANLMQPRNLDQNSLAFYQGLNFWLERVRRSEQTRSQ